MSTTPAVGHYSFPVSLPKIEFRVDLRSHEPVQAVAGGVQFTLTVHSAERTTTLVKPIFSLKFDLFGRLGEAGDNQKVLDLLEADFRDIDRYESPFTACNNNGFFSFKTEQARLPRKTKDDLIRTVSATISFTLSKPGLQHQVELLLPHTHTPSSLPPSPLQTSLDTIPSLLSTPADLALSASHPAKTATSDHLLYTSTTLLTTLSDYLATLAADSSLYSATRGLLDNRPEFVHNADSDVEDGDNDDGEDEIEDEDGADVVVEAGDAAVAEEEEEAHEPDADEEEVSAGNSLKRRRSASTTSATSSRRCRCRGTDWSALGASTTSPSPLKKEERASSGAETLPSPTASSSADLDDNGDELVVSQVRRIAVPDVAFSTLQAVLTWMSCKFIVFAPLRSVSQYRHKAFVRHYKEEHPTRPCPVSPRSVYRLAERFGLTELEDLALAELEKQLTPVVAINLVLQPDTRFYPKFKNLVFGYIGDNRIEIKRTSAWSALPGRTTAATYGVYGELLSHLYAAKQEAKKAAQEEPKQRVAKRLGSRRIIVFESDRQ